MSNRIAIRPRAIDVNGLPVSGVVWTLYPYDESAPFFTRNVDGGYTIGTVPTAAALFDEPTGAGSVGTITSAADGYPPLTKYVGSGHWALVGEVGSRAFVNVIQNHDEVSGGGYADLIGFAQITDHGRFKVSGETTTDLNGWYDIDLNGPAKDEGGQSNSLPEISGGTYADLQAFSAANAYGLFHVMGDATPSNNGWYRIDPNGPTKD